MAPSFEYVGFAYSLGGTLVDISMAASNKNEQKSDLIGGYQDINEFTQV